MYISKKELEVFQGEVMNDLTRDELMDTILAFLSSIFNYNSVVSKNSRVNVVDLFMLHKNVSSEELSIAGGGVDLEQLNTEELKQLTVDSFLSYTIALTGLQDNPMLPLIVDDNASIRVIEHTA